MEMADVDAPKGLKLSARDGGPGSGDESVMGEEVDGIGDTLRGAIDVLVERDGAKECAGDLDGEGGNGMEEGVLDLWIGLS